MTKINIEVSARHVHLSQEHLEKLFGRKHKLKPVKPLSQKGQFAAEETVRIKNKQGKIKKVRVLGPVRRHTQIEISQTDAYKFKISPPVRKSGDLKGSAGLVLIGPKGKVKLKRGVIIAWRHIHIHPKDAKKYGLADGDRVSVKIENKRGVTFHNVLVRVRKDFVWRMHVDTDEGNAAGVAGTAKGELI